MTEKPKTLAEAFERMKDYPPFSQPVGKACAEIPEGETRA